MIGVILEQRKVVRSIAALILFFLRSISYSRIRRWFFSKILRKYVLGIVVIATHIKMSCSKSGAGTRYGTYPDGLQVSRLVGSGPLLGLQPGRTMVAEWKGNSAYAP